MRVRWGRALLVLPFVAALLFVPASAEAHPSGEECGANQSLAKDATYVEHDTKTKRGRPVDYVYHKLVGIKSGGRVIPVHNGGPHGLESAYSPTNSEGLLYAADMSVYHWLSDPCTGPDSYAYAVNTICFVDASMAWTPCLFDAWVGLQTTPTGLNNWGAPWGYSHRKNASPRGFCHADGVPHQIVDNALEVRTWLYLDGSFTAPSPDWPFNARKSTSKEFITGASHNYTNGPCWPDWCDATTPPNNNAAVAFDSCQTA